MAPVPTAIAAATLPDVAVPSVPSLPSLLPTSAELTATRRIDASSVAVGRSDQRLPQVAMAVPLAPPEFAAAALAPTIERRPPPAEPPVTTQPAAVEPDAKRPDETRREAERTDAERLAAQQQAAAQREAESDIATRLERERSAVGRLQEAQRAAADTGASQAEAASQATSQEIARVEQARLEAERLQAVSQEARRQEARVQEEARQAAAQREATAKATAKANAAAAAKAAAEAAVEAAATATAAAAARQEAARLQAVRDEDESRESRRRAMGRQLDAEATQRAAGPAELRPPGALAHALGSARRGRLFGHTDANAELLRYAEAWALKIQLNTATQAFREAAQQPHADPVVTVALRADGSVESVNFVRSSGVPEVDDAVRRMVLSQAPYPAFSPELSSDFDVVEIRRTWYFDNAVRLY